MIFSELDVSAVLGLTAAAASVAGIVSSWSEFNEISESKNVGNRSGIVYSSLWLNQVMWLFYGCMVWNVFVIAINTFTSLVASRYLMVYYTYSTSKPIRNLYLLKISFALAVLVLCFLSRGNQLFIYRLGIVGAGTTVLQYAAPLSVLGTVIRTKSAELLPVRLVMANTLASTCWSVYGVMVHLFWLYVSNGIGSLFGLVQLFLIVLYGGHRSTLATFPELEEKSPRDV